MLSIEEMSQNCRHFPGAELPLQCTSPLFMWNTTVFTTKPKKTVTSNVCWHVVLYSPQCYHLATVFPPFEENHSLIFECTLGNETAVGSLTTWRAALKNTWRIKLFISDGNVFPACWNPSKIFYFSAARLFQICFAFPSFIAHQGDIYVFILNKP